MPKGASVRYSNDEDTNMFRKGCVPSQRRYSTQYRNYDIFMTFRRVVCQLVDLPLLPYLYACTLAISRQQIREVIANIGVVTVSVHHTSYVNAVLRYPTATAVACYVC